MRRRRGGGSGGGKSVPVPYRTAQYGCFMIEYGTRTIRYDVHKLIGWNREYDDFLASHSLHYGTS